MKAEYVRLFDCERCKVVIFAEAPIFNVEMAIATHNLKTHLIPIGGTVPLIPGKGAVRQPRAVVQRKQP